MKTYAFSFVFLFSLLCSIAHAQPVGFKTETVTPANHRALEVAYWYPTKNANEPTTVLENGVFHGVTANLNAPPTEKKYPLVVISHGFMGYFGNQSWLAVELASRGFIVAAPNHSGTSHTNRDRDASKELWRRPKDLSVIIDYVMNSPKLAGKVDETRIYAIGHSLGAWSVMLTAGAQFSHQHMLQACKHTRTIECDIYRGLTSDDSESGSEMNLKKLAGDLSDKRIKGIVMLDMGDTLVKGFTQASLQDVSVPALIIDADAKSSYLADKLSHAKRVQLDGASHFSFLQRCKPLGYKILEAKGDGILCLDGEGARRQELHKQSVDLIVSFFQEMGI